MMKFFKQKNKKENWACPAKPWRSGGFTLVETLVAISIFSVSIIALMAVLASGVSDINYAKRKITATYLAQEGIEYVRNMRDNAFLSADPNTGWINFVATSTTVGIIYPSDDNINFPRIIQVEEVNPNEVKISSKVSWTQGSGHKSVTFSENLFNWFGQ